MDEVQRLGGGTAARVEARGEVEEAFAGLVARQAGVMFRVASTVLRRGEDAEEAVQEAFLRMYRSGGWRGVQEERAYAARVVWREAVRRWRRMRGRREDGDAEALAAVPTGDPGAAEVMEQAGERERLLRLIEGLPAGLRRPLLLCAIEEMGSREVGVVLGLPEGTVRRRVMRAKQELRRRFEATGGGR